MRPPKNTGLYLIAFTVILGTFGFLAMLFFREIPVGNKDSLTLAGGALLAGFSGVIGYFFGSSRGSAEKTELLKMGHPKENTPPTPN